MLSSTHRNEVARCAGDAKSINVIRVEVDFERGKICYKKEINFISPTESKQRICSALSCEEHSLWNIIFERGAI